jgi:hypothetical protein
MQEGSQKMKKHKNINFSNGDYQKVSVRQCFFYDYPKICIAGRNNYSEPDLGFWGNPHPDPNSDPSF